MQRSAGVFLLMAFCTLTARAQGTFVYTNNDRVPNNISAFSAAANGTLSPVAGSPFATGGNGSGGGFFAANRITTAVINNVLYAANTTSNNVSAFSINPVTGVLTALPGSPFATGGIAGAGAGMSLTATPDKKFLIAANGTSETITVFSVAANGTLSQVPGSPFASGASAPLVNAKATSDGKFLAVTATPGTILMFTISATGALAPAAGSPLTDAGAAGIDCNCAGTQLFVALNGTSTKVDVFDIDINGGLSRIAGAPFIGLGLNSNVAVLSPDDSSLFVTDQGSNTISVFSAAANGSLAIVPGSPFAVAGSTIPVGAATNRAGNLLYTASFNNLISGFSIAANGALTPVPGSPFSNGFPGQFGLLSLAVFPAKTCCPAPIISNVSATPDILWPPNHKLVDVTIDYAVTEPCPHKCVLSVSSDEPINGVGDGNTSPDWQVIDAHHALLRAERSGPGNGRIYTVTITCTNDLNQETSSKNVLVLVPHDQSRSNRIDDPLFLVHQQYLDFLNREPDRPGSAHWTNEITMCTDSANRLPGETESQCIDRKRANTSGAFYLSNEFQDSANFLIRVNWGSLGQGRAIGQKCIVGQYSALDAVCRPLYSDYISDLAKLTQGIVLNDALDPNAINTNKHNFVKEFVTRPDFLAAYASTMTAADYVDKLAHTTGIPLTDQERADLIAKVGTDGRAAALYDLVDGTTTIDGGALVFNTRYGKAFYDQEFNPAFVLVEYLGYLRRNPDQAGFDHWLGKLNLYGNFVDAEMVRAFIVSDEYRQRFGPN